MRTVNNVMFGNKGNLRAILTLFLLLGITAFPKKTQAQTYQLVTSSHVKVTGTSNIHDWNMTATNFTCEADFKAKNGVLNDLNSLSFTLPVVNLKGKENLLNTRAHKALKADTYSKIAFKLTKATVVSPQKIINAIGNLTIAGVTNQVTLKVAYIVNADESITCRGTEIVNMSNYKIKAPSFMMGALKVGDKVTIDLLLKLKK